MCNPICVLSAFCDEFSVRKSALRHVEVRAKPFYILDFGINDLDLPSPSLPVLLLARLVSLLGHRLQERRWKLFSRSIILWNP